MNLNLPRIQGRTAENSGMVTGYHFVMLKKLLAGLFRRNPTPGHDMQMRKPLIPPLAEPYYCRVRPTGLLLLLTSRLVCQSR